MRVLSDLIILKMWAQPVARAMVAVCSFGAGMGILGGLLVS